MRTLGLALPLLFASCYASHEPADAGGRVADAGARDAGPTCRFTVAASSRTVTCAISTASVEACAEAAMCLCRGVAPAPTESEVLACASSDLTARGAITFADFCTESPPARTTIASALRGLLGDRGSAPRIDTSPECDSVPALIGTRPFEPCGAIAARLCSCAPRCDLDAALGVACLTLSAAHADCIRRRVVSTTDCAFVAELPATVRACRS